MACALLSANNPTLQCAKLYRCKNYQTPLSSYHLPFGAVELLVCIMTVKEQHSKCTYVCFHLYFFQEMSEKQPEHKVSATTFLSR